MRPLLTREHGVQHRLDDPLHLLPLALRDDPARSGGEDEIYGGADCPKALWAAPHVIRSSVSEHAKENVWQMP